MNTRRYDIDWLRIIAVLLLFPYHVARIFNLDEEFYVKSAALSKGLSYFVEYLGPWHMPLLFFLAGASTWFALSHRSGLRYAGERFKRLFIPFIVGLVLLIPPQSYLGILSHGGEPGSFFNWLPTFFHLSEVDPDGYFMGGLTFGHLWFIIHLFFYSIIALPIVLFLRRGAGRWVIDFLARLATKPVVILLFGVFALPATLVPDIAGGNPVFYGITFLLGYLVVADARFEQAIDKHKLAALVLGPVACLAVAYFDVKNSTGLSGWTADAYELYVGIFLPWFCLVAFMGYGRRFLRSDNRLLKYAAPASYPVYLLHQTVIVAVGFTVLKAGLGVPLSFAAILIGSLVGSIVIYELLRRVNVLRFLFGMKTVRRGRAGLRPELPSRPTSSAHDPALSHHAAPNGEGAPNRA